MAQLKSLPDELLLDIALRLQPPDLKDLALTARQFRDIAQEALHTSISLMTYYQSLPELLITLVGRPDLAKKVRSLQITGYRSPQQVYRSAVGYDDSWDQVVTHAMKSTHSWPIDQMKWASRVKYGDLHACIGLLLVLTDQLQNLAFCSGDNQDFMTPRSLSLTFPGIAERHAVTAPGTLLLPQLRRLSVAWGEMDRSWSTFPNLLHLDLDCTGPVAWDKEPVILFHGITTLTLRRPTLYEYQPADTQDLSPFFQRLPALRSLRLCFTNWRKKDGNMYDGIRAYYSSYDPGIPTEERICYPKQEFTSSIIIDPLIPASHLLEELELKCSDTGDSKQIDYLRPSRSLQRFTLIKRLSIPQSVLINSTPYECSPLHPFEALPPNVEYLDVADPTTAVIEWISGVLDDRSKLRSLKRISLDFDNDPKQRVKDYKEAGVEIFGRLLEAGISVHFENVRLVCLEACCKE
ncbi:uncharacterized protein J4E84_007752 [Alternaria hordeiaustralica]|uniref:uncharacterized protein n=1 Tax=Alternaria hordeiaustralica TaxID=1187925 RepID=UPI0020C24B4A|nr:uncharacterized protein J4E84_007752 [Alternaria hordeiaustralica]KAI4680614.1 hypothetical protein J4E84_007752 [Alternaria hordeiaustralica]